MIINSKHEEIIIKIELKINFDLAHNFIVYQKNYYK